MKIALVIFRIHPSHGCILQTYALYNTLKSLGHDVKIIDKQQRITIQEWIQRTKGLAISKVRGGYKGPVFYCGIEPKGLMKRLNPFVEKYLGEDLYRIYDFKDLVGIVLKGYEAFIVGSDQVWRPKYVPRVTYYYLDFLPDDCTAKRIAYAPSFGTDKWEYNEIQHEQCKRLIKRFNAVSVREDSGVSMCKEFFGVEAKKVLDPTMLLTKNDYEIILDKRSLNKEKILSYYFLDETSEKMTYMEGICKKLKLQGQRINTKTENGKAKLNERIAPSMEEWLGGFAKSEFVVVDSFHAMVFAILFNTPFIVVANAARGTARFSSLLSKLGLENRLITDISNIPTDLLNQEIDWDCVNDMLDSERELCINYLRNALAV